VTINWLGSFHLDFGFYPSIFSTAIPIRTCPPYISKGGTRGIPSRYNYILFIFFNPPVVPLRQGGQALHNPTFGVFIDYFAQFLSEGIPFWWLSRNPKGRTRGIPF